MKYWFFDGSDVIGPFFPDELVANKSFDAASLICPENFSDDGDHWQPAVLFTEVKALLAKNAPESDENTITFEEEMDTLLKEHSPLSFDEAPTDGPDLEIPKKPAKPGPIEDYFNNIKKEDLGDILGIPDPNEDSDMDLAHALETQLAKTSSTRRKKREIAEETEPVVDSLEATHRVATATEVFATQEPVATLPQTLPTLPSSTLPTLALEKEVDTFSPQDLQPLDQRIETQNFSLTSLQQEPAPVSPVEFEEKPKVLLTKVQEPAPQVIPNPALLRAEKVEVNSVRAQLKQTQEMKEFLSETQNSHLKKQDRNQRKIMVILLAALVILVALMFTIQSRHPTTTDTPSTSSTSTQSSDYTQELLPTEPTTTAVTVAAPAPAVVSTSYDMQEQKALAIAQNYPLSGNRGSIANYLNKIYQPQFAQGYLATWGAEPLYKNTYIVKYRLTKTRKEPIIYVFQVDVAANKLTGALNNISLDLVGKI